MTGFIRVISSLFPATNQQNNTSSFCGHIQIRARMSWKWVEYFCKGNSLTVSTKGIVQRGQKKKLKIIWTNVFIHGSDLHTL